MHCYNNLYCIRIAPTLRKSGGRRGKIFEKISSRFTVGLHRSLLGAYAVQRDPIRQYIGLRRNDSGQHHRPFSRLGSMKKIYNKQYFVHYTNIEYRLWRNK